MSLARLGAFLQKQTHTPVRVDPAIADRKVSVFVEDRPLAEVLQRVEDTLFLTLTKDKYGYFLRLDKKAAIEENAVAEDEAELARLAVKDFLVKRAALTGKSADELRDEATRLEQEIPELYKDPSPAGQLRLQEANQRFAQIESLRTDRTAWDEGFVAAQMTPRSLDALLSGQPLFASVKPREGMLKLSPEALSMAPDWLRGRGDTDMLLSMKFDPYRESLDVEHRALGPEGGGASSGFRFDATTNDEVLKALDMEALSSRLVSWAKILDSAVLKAPLDRKADRPVPGPERVYTLADNLQWLHDATGVPIVADAFRRFAGFDRVTPAPDVGAWIKAFNVDKYSQADWFAALVRTEGGWLMMRNRRYWQYLPQEPPERFIAPMEDKAALKQELTLEDYAAFAYRLTPAQEAGVSSENFIVGFPAAPLYGNIPALRVWGSLSSASRGRAYAHGLAFAEMPPDTQDLCLSAMSETLWTMPSAKILPYLLPGGPSFPEEMKLFAEASGPDRTVSGSDTRPWFRPGLSDSTQTIPYRAVSLIFGPTAESDLSYDIMLGPLPQGK